MHALRRLFVAALASLFTISALATNYVGDYAPGDTVDCNFGTVRPSTGASFTLAGTPAISAYKDNGTTESTTGVTLSADFDSRTGLNHVRVTTGSDGTFYAAGTFIELVITTGTVDSISVVGQPVCSFSLTKVSALRPTTAARTLDVTATGEAGIDWANIGAPTTTVGLTGTTVDLVANAVDAAAAAADLTTELASASQASLLVEALVTLGVELTADSGTATTVVDAALTQADNNWFLGQGVLFTSGTLLGQTACITAFTAASDTLTITTVTAAVSTQTYYILPIAKCQTGDAFARLGTPSGASIAADIGTRASQASLDTVDDFVDTEVAAIKAKTDNLPVDPADDSDIDAEIAGVQADTDNLQTRVPAALVGGRMDSSIGAVAANVITASALAADAATEIRDAILDYALLSGVTAKCALQLMSAYTSGPWTNGGAGGLTTTYRDPSNTTNLIVVTRAMDGSSVTVDSFTCP